MLILRGQKIILWLCVEILLQFCCARIEYHALLQKRYSFFWMVCKTERFHGDMFECIPKWPSPPEARPWACVYHDLILFIWFRNRAEGITIFAYLLLAKSARQNLDLPFFFRYKHIPSLKNLPSPAPNEYLPYWVQGNFAALFVLNFCFREFLLSAFANRFELRYEPKQLMLLHYKLWLCCVVISLKRWSSFTSVRKNETNVISQIWIQ